jgi:hypothetical protein
MLTEAELAKMRAEAKDVVRKGERRYQKLAPELEAKYKGQFVSIEPESGEYVVAKDHLEIMGLGDARFGEKLRYCRGIGFQHSRFS